MQSPEPGTAGTKEAGKIYRIKLFVEHIRVNASHLSYFLFIIINVFNSCNLQMRGINSIEIMDVLLRSLDEVVNIRGLINHNII